MAERLKAAVLKTVEGYTPSQGSNPCLSAMTKEYKGVIYLIKILLVDDHEVLRTGIHRLLSDIEDFEIVAEANSGEQAIEFVATHPVDVILMDIKMPGIGGLEATSRLLQIEPKLKIIVLSAFTDDPYPYHLAAAGAKGYLTKACPIQEIINAIRAVFSGETYFESKIAGQLVLKTIKGEPNQSPFSLLSTREMQVVLMLMNACTVTDIAHKLHLSDKTVSTYRYRVFGKLQIKNNVELIRLAMQHGVLESP